MFKNKGLNEYIYRKCSDALIRQRKLKQKMKTHSAGELKIVHIETRTKCNGICMFCAAASQYNSREDKKMPGIIFRKIISDLSDINYKNRISLYCNNEPLLDDRIYDFIKFVKNKCPLAIVELKTNGVLLNEKNLKKIGDTGLDYLYINDYHSSKTVSERLIFLKNKYSQIGNTIVQYVDRRFDETLNKNNRSGTNPAMSSNPQSLDLFCYRPFEMLTFTVDGSATVCSDDIFFRNSIGKIDENITVSDLWQGNEINKIRDHLLNQHRDYMESCKFCDYQGLEPGHQYTSLFRYLLPLVISAK